MLGTGMSRVIVTGVLPSLYGSAMTTRRYVSFIPNQFSTANGLLQIVCVGSVEELERLSGVQGINDLHRDKIDHITIPSKQGKGNLKRVEEVFDCWFESGR